MKKLTKNDIKEIRYSLKCMAENTYYGIDKARDITAYIVDIAKILVLNGDKILDEAHDEVRD